MNIQILLNTENEYEMTDVIGAFHFGLQLAREQMKAKKFEVWAKILEEIHENDPSIQNII